MRGRIYAESCIYTSIRPSLRQRRRLTAESAAGTIITQYYRFVSEEGDVRRDFEVITFKADRDLLDAMKGISNRSAFIRQAILSALESTCPLCNGTGVLTPSQQSHWTEFSERHRVAQCEKCSEVHLVCDAN